MTFSFRPAKREQISLLIGLVGGTGSGKSYSAMRLAKGIAGEKPFAVIDTENRRALHYADSFKFDHADLREPFRPESYAEAIKAADAAGYPVIVVDSASHVWAGHGGVLDWQEEELDRIAGQDFGKREKCKMAAWIKPKLSHKGMIQDLLQVRAHVILCHRAEKKIEMVKNPQTGKLEMQEKKSMTGLDGWIPICEKNLPFELTTSILLTADRPGIPRPIKLQEQHRVLFPLDRPIDEETGRRIAEWACGASAPSINTTTGRLSESVVVDYCAAIESCTSIGELEKQFVAAIKASAELRDVSAKNRFVSSKDKQKSKLLKTDLHDPRPTSPACDG